MSYGNYGDGGGRRQAPRNNQQQDGPGPLYTGKFHRQARSLDEKVINSQTGKEEGKVIAKEVLIPEGVEETLTVSFNAERIQRLIEELQAAANDPSGTGGVTMRFYARKQVGQNGRPFNGAHVITWATKPMTQGFGGQRGNYGGQRQQGGRKAYPSAPPQQRPESNGYGYGDEDYPNDDAGQDTPPASPPPRGGQTRSTSKAGPGRTAQKPASPSKPLPGAKEAKDAMEGLEQGPPELDDYI
jgi:hypothetical protein